MSNTCIYRYINTGKCCNFRAKCNNYCNIHNNNRNIIYDIINDATINKNCLTENDIYNIYKYIYDNEKIYVKELIFKKILATIYNKIKILKYLYSYLFTHKCHNIIDKIYELNKNTYEIEKKLNDKIYKIQKIVKYNFIKKHIYKSSLDDKINNTNDPFTFDNINDINEEERFIYNDGNNYYCFKAIELLYFIETKGNNWNPYTKKDFEPNLINKLKLFIDYFKLIDKKKNNIWNSNLQAFTDVSQALEKIGFYNNTDWFLKLTSSQIKNIIRLFKIVSANNSISNNFFNEIDINDETIFFDFARETIKLFEDGNSHFILCCNFMKALSMYSNDFYDNIPEWMSDIETPIIINTTNNIFHRIINNLDITYLINIIET
jgi:hypothetical protein